MPARLSQFFDPPQQQGDRALRRIFWTALIVRLLYITLAHTYRIRVANDHFEFGWEMGRIARALATGHGFADPFEGRTGPTAWTPPLYPLLLAATAPAVYQIARRTFARTPDARAIALWSAWLWALYPAAMQYAVRWVWDMSLTACLFAWIIVLALRLRGLGGPTTPPQPVKLWPLFGLLWGLIALSNSSLLAFLPACVLWIVWRTLRQPSTLRNLAISAVIFSAVVSPWVIRNYAAFHAFVPMRSNFGAELYESAQLENEGYPWVATLPHAQADPDFQRYKRLGELVYSREQGARAWAIIRTHRRVFLAHMLKRVWFFWVSVPHPTGETFKGLLNETAREMSYAFLSLSGLLGLALALRNRIPGAWLFFWAFVTIPLLYYVVTVQARFRHPIEPLLCVLAVYLFRSAQPATRTKA